ncbi:MAG: hypothetical protein DDT40_00753 [candidate division WS2 bacterium]|uniref:DRTGG domain-containing protein n=1 Tax=Psychracetigena formicireducens TaxID=2986056 RepID=A0A9E2BJL4_PSYF1|nr:hypothetical protein [Candidatus Psychracetigena formicireducens]MBT9144294.1 hypothetical protein [Candidatus Psychracetigena formicireducens]MBT9150581.1 hypothetical protein [Candidatus Psychracetigena formicireducens]
MLLREVIDSLNLQVISEGNLEVEVRSGIVSDLLSYVMGNAKEGDLWLTIQTHMNVVAVASLCKVAAVIVTSNLEVNEEVIDKAQEEGITILKSSLPSYELSGSLYLSGIR